jgi:hypothetical protein
MSPRLQIEELTIEVTRKAIKHAYLRVDGAGQARMSVPRRMPKAGIEAFARPPSPVKLVNQDPGTL